MRQLLFPYILLLAGTAQAQIRLSGGPKLGLNAASAQVSDRELPTGYRSASSTQARLGVEAGLLGSLETGHFGVQLAALYSQKGYEHYRNETLLAAPTEYYGQNVRLDYLTFPLNLAFMQHANGQGLQAVAGPYVSVLVGGRYQTEYSTSALPTIRTGSQEVVAGDAPLITPYFHTQRLDAGWQVGFGYRHGPLLAQAAYSVGLRNLAVKQTGYAFGGTLDFAPFYSRTLQLSLAYLVNFIAGK